MENNTENENTGFASDLKTESGEFSNKELSQKLKDTNYVLVAVIVLLVVMVVTILIMVALFLVEQFQRNHSIYQQYNEEKQELMIEQQREILDLLE